MQKIIKYTVFLLIILIGLLWIFDFSFSNKQFNYYKIKNLLSKEDIAYLKRKSTEFIDYDFITTKKKKSICLKITVPSLKNFPINF